MAREGAGPGAPRGEGPARGVCAPGAPDRTRAYRREGGRGHLRKRRGGRPRGGRGAPRGLQGVHRGGGAREGGDGDPPPARGDGPRGRGRGHGADAVRPGPREGPAVPRRVDGEGDRPPVPGEVRGSRHVLRPRPCDPARARPRDEVAGDVQEAAGGARVSGFGPAPEGDRFLPSVLTLEASMRAGKQSLADGRLGEALGHFNPALKLKPRYDVAWIARGQVLKLQGDLDEALKSFAEALVLKPENEEAWIALAGVLHRMRRLQEEGEAHDQVLRLNPRKLEALINKGAALHGLRRYAEAEACYDSVLAVRPEYAAAWNNKGAALLRRGKVDDALDALERATRLDPDFFDAYVNRAFAWQRKGKHGHAVIAADRALKIREPPWLWTVKGLSHLALLESSLAARCFERALALDPKQKEARASLGKAKELRERVDLYRGAYECFGTFEAGDAGCAEGGIQARGVEVARGRCRARRGSGTRTGPPRRRSRHTSGWTRRGG